MTVPLHRVEAMCREARNSALPSPERSQKQPQVFILTTAFSALDLKTDAALRRALAKKVADKTVIIVAQRISTILHADQILVLNDGRIVGKGTHEELLRGCETYREIARSQMSAKELGMEEQEVSVNE